MGKNVTRGAIERINQLYGELDVLAELSSDAIKLAQTNKDIRKLKVTRDTGKVVEITEAVAWEEIKYLGAKSEAYAIMKTTYPDVFEKADNHQKKVKEIDNFTLAELGIHFDKVTMRDIVNVVDKLVGLKVVELIKDPLFISGLKTSLGLDKPSEAGSAITEKK